MSLAESVLKGDPRALSRLLTQVENDTPDGRRALTDLFPRTGKAHLVGVTGIYGPGAPTEAIVNHIRIVITGRS